VHDRSARHGAAVHPEPAVRFPCPRHRRLRRLPHGGAGFLALAHTLKKGEHIRVTLLLTHLQGSARRALELWSLGLGGALAVLLALYSCRLAWQSHAFHDISTGSDATPLWIPQLSMAVGSVIFALALLDELWLELRGRRASPSDGEALRNE